MIFKTVSWSQRLLVPLAAAVLSVPALAQSVPFPTYSPGENTTAPTGPTYSHPLSNPWVVSDGTILTPVGTQVYLGIKTRAKAVALNPTGNHTAAVLTNGCRIRQPSRSSTPRTGAVLQSYSVHYGAWSTDSDGSNLGITYTPDGKYLLFSQDSSYGPSSYVSIASVSPTAGSLSDYAHVSVPLDVNAAEGLLSTVTCYPYNPPAKYKAKPPVNAGSPPGTTGSFQPFPCGHPCLRFHGRSGSTSYPTGIAVTRRRQDRLRRCWTTTIL